MLFRKEVDLECLKEINDFAQSIGLEPQAEDLAQQENYEEIVWMDDYLQTEKYRMEELKSELEQ